MGGSFHGYVTNNQIVNIKQSNIVFGCLWWSDTNLLRKSFTDWLHDRRTPCREWPCCIGRRCSGCVLPTWQSGLKVVNPILLFFERFKHPSETVVDVELGLFYNTYSYFATIEWGLFDSNIAGGCDCGRDPENLQRTIRRTRWRKRRCHDMLILWAQEAACFSKSGIKHPVALDMKLKINKITRFPVMEKMESISTAQKMEIWMVRSMAQAIWMMLGSRFVNTPEASMSILENQGPLKLECEASAHPDRSSDSQKLKKMMNMRFEDACIGFQARKMSKKHYHLVMTFTVRHGKIHPCY